ncbi:MAG: hypothetical protein HGA19_00120 [Oscillochloris sp.]|nr:hypothetical protein [Oscillochloris sp.]
MRPLESIHPQLPPLRLVNRHSEEYVGACPFCGGDAGSDRFHVWMAAAGGRPARRFWCRNCGEKGLIDRRFSTTGTPDSQFHIQISARLTDNQKAETRQPHAPCQAHIPYYRQLYALVALWAHTNLFDPTNPDPLRYIQKRGLSSEDAQRHLLGYGLFDPQALPTYLSSEATEILPYAEEAGLLIRDRSGGLRTHPNLCGAITFPYIADSQVIDIRMRRVGSGHKTRSLPGSYEDRGATLPMGWDTLEGEDTILLTESGEFKALLPQAYYEAGRLSLPTMGHPGLTNFRASWGKQLLDCGIRSVIIAYDSQPRPVRNGLIEIAPEEAATIRHGQALTAAGLEVRVLRLPLAPGETKADLDSFLLRYGPQPLQALIDTAPLLYDYQRAIPRLLLDQAKLAPATTYPTHRSRPRQLTHSIRPDDPPEQPIALDEARTQISEQVYEHATQGQGFLVLAHPPGTGKGHNTAAALATFKQNHPEAGRLVWTALRKDQLHDQQELSLQALHGRNSQNCRKIDEATILNTKGYHVRQALCERRCTHLNYCTYLRQFTQEGDFFAPLPLLQATRWWADAGVVVLDEFDPARLTRTTSITLSDLATMSRATSCPHTKAILGWIGQILSTTFDRVLTGTLFYAELAHVARVDGMNFWASLEHAIKALPPPEDQALLPGLACHAMLSDYEALPPAHLATLLAQMRREGYKELMGKHYTSRIEARKGVLQIFLRIEHLIAQLANPDQPKIILDATANEGLLRAIFPQTPVKIVQPTIAGGMRVIQEVSRDWAKSTLQGKRREQWYDSVASHIRPNQKTLVVCTLDCENDLKQALAARGHPEVKIAHYGALRGTNAYVGHDVILAQIYHPNLEHLIREGRALFADNATALDERIIIVERTLTDATGKRWVIQVPTFADSRLAALLESRREHELVQAALRGRPLDHPQTQITILFSLPLPGLVPTIISEAPASPNSNAGRQATAWAALLAAAQQSLESGQRQIDVQDLARQTGLSVVTVRTHWQQLATRLHLTPITRRRVVILPNGGKRTYARAVLLRRGRNVPKVRKTVTHTPVLMDQANNHDPTSCLIRHTPHAYQRSFRRSVRIGRCGQNLRYRMILAAAGYSIQLSIHPFMENQRE